MGSLGEFNFLSKTSDWLRLNSDLLMANFLMIMCCKCHRCVLWTSGSADCKNIDTVHKNMLAVSSESKSIRGPKVRFIAGDGPGCHAQLKLQFFLMIWATLNGWSPWNWSSKTSELQIFLMIWRISLVPQMPSQVCTGCEAYHDRANLRRDSLVVQLHVLKLTFTSSSQEATKSSSPTTSITCLTSHGCPAQLVMQTQSFPTVSSVLHAMPSWLSTHG